MTTAEVMTCIRRAVAAHQGDDAELYAALCEEAERWRMTLADIRRMEAALELGLDPEDLPLF